VRGGDDVGLIGSCFEGVSDKAPNFVFSERLQVEDTGTPCFLHQFCVRGETRKREVEKEE
jgi:hypothetical protein